MSYKTINKLFLIPYLVNMLFKIFIIVGDSQWQTGGTRVCSLHRLILLYLFQNKTKYLSLVLTSLKSRNQGMYRVK